MDTPSQKGRTSSMWRAVRAKISTDVHLGGYGLAFLGSACYWLIPSVQPVVGGATLYVGGFFFVHGMLHLTASSKVRPRGSHPRRWGTALLLLTAYLAIVLTLAYTPVGPLGLMLVPLLAGLSIFFFGGVSLVTYCDRPAMRMAAAVADLKLTARRWLIGAGAVLVVLTIAAVVHAATVLAYWPDLSYTLFALTTVAGLCTVTVVGIALTAIGSRTSSRIRSRLIPVIGYLLTFSLPWVMLLGVLVWDVLGGLGEPHIPLGGTILLLASFLWRLHTAGEALAGRFNRETAASLQVAGALGTATMLMAMVSDVSQFNLSVAMLKSTAVLGALVGGLGYLGVRSISLFRGSGRPLGNPSGDETPSSGQGPRKSGETLDPGDPPLIGEEGSLYARK